MKISSFIPRATVDPLENAPYLFPWYVHDSTPRIVRNEIELDWHYREKVGDEYVGVVMLCHAEKVLGLFTIYDCIHPSSTGKEFCVWKQARKDGKVVNELNLDFFRVTELAEIEDVEKKMLLLSRDKSASYILESDSVSRLSISLDKIDRPISIQFPGEFGTFDNFIAVVGVDALYDEAASHETALLEIKPNASVAVVHPQDWFNKDPQIDFGYQWITRAARDFSTGRIVGEGIRISRFELDESDRQLRRVS